MKKLYISIPMEGRTKENIKKSIEIIHLSAELFFGEDLEVITVPFESADFEDDKQEITYISRCIEKMAEADYFASVEPHLNFREGYIAACVAEVFEKEVYYLNQNFVLPDVLSSFLKRQIKHIIDFGITGRRGTRGTCVEDIK